MRESLDPARPAPPPRTIEMPLAARILLGSAASQVGWLVLGFGSIFLWTFALHADVSGWRFQPPHAGRTAGISLDCRETHFSEGGSRYRQGIRIYENRYRYAVSGQAFEGSSYAVGRCLAGGAVQVEYLLAQPGFSRIAGMRRQPISPWGTVVALMPATGLGMIVFAYVRGRRHLRLLRDGLPAAARLIERTRTNMRANGRQVYRMTFEYPTQSGTAGRISVRTYRTRELEDEPRKLLFYDPALPARAVLLASVPGNVTFDDAGQPAASGSFAFLLLPALTALGNCWYAYLY